MIRREFGLQVEDEEGNFDLQRLTLNTQVSALNVRRQVVLVVRVPHHVNHPKVFAGQVGICIRKLSYSLPRQCARTENKLRSSGFMLVREFESDRNLVPPITSHWKHCDFDRLPVKQR